MAFAGDAVPMPPQASGYVNRSVEEDVGPSFLDELKNASVDLDAYSMDGPRRGLALILNHYEFHPDMNLDPRTGTHRDVTSLTTTLRSFGLKVHVCNDAPAYQIEKLLCTVSEKTQKTDDCLVVAVLTHGTAFKPEDDNNKKMLKKNTPLRAGLVAAWDCWYSPEELWLPFVGKRCRQLVGKPKLFIVQACRGCLKDYGELQMDSTDVEADWLSPRPTIPIMADILVAYATPLGFVSIRNLDHGTYFIQALCYVLNHTDAINGLKCRHDIVSALTVVAALVARLVGRVRTEHRFESLKQIPSFTSTLTKQLRFYRVAEWHKSEPLHEVQEIIDRIHDMKK